MVQRTIVLTGIGGQGIQLAAKTLATAALTDGRQVQLFSSYGGMMRGGNSDAYLVISDGPVVAPPVPGSAWAAIVMHHEHAAGVWEKLGPDSITVINDSVVDPTCRPSERRGRVVEVDAVAIATESGAAQAASLAAIGAFVGATSIVSETALLGSSAQVLPSYRSEAASANRQVLAAGLEASEVLAEAWLAESAMGQS